jgi:hypothetical protein
VSGESPLPDDSEPVAGRTSDAPQLIGAQAYPVIPRTIRAWNTPPKIRKLLERLDINRDSEWVWMTTADRLSPELPRFSVDDGGPRRYVPLDPDDAKAFEEFTLEMLGIRLDEGDPIYGRLSFPEDRPTDVRYIRVRWQRSVLYAEYTATKREHGVAIHGAHLRHSAEERERAWDAVGLIFKGPERGRPSGSKRGSKQAHWRGRAQAIGEPAARAEYNTAEPRVAGRYKWWDSNILRWMRRQKHHQ